MEKKTPELDHAGQEKALARVYELLELCNNAKKPNSLAREELDLLIRSTPICMQAIRRQHDLYVIALRGRIEHPQASDTFKEIQYVKIRQLKEELGYDTANRIEQLAIDHIVLCYINYYQTEVEHAGNLLTEHSKESGIYWEKRLAYASRRYVKSLELLSKMRKMSLTVQINTGVNQVVANAITSSKFEKT